LPCDTCSSHTILEKIFPNLDFSVLGDKWYAKDGPYTADGVAVEARTKAVRQILCELVEKLERERTTAEGTRSIVVVTHRVFMKVLTQDEAIDLLKAGWKAFTLLKQDNGGDGYPGSRHWYPAFRPSNGTVHLSAPPALNFVQRKYVVVVVYLVMLTTENFLRFERYIPVSRQLESSSLRC
jgi:hypothetical protein